MGYVIWWMDRVISWDISGFQIQYAQNKAFTKKAKIYNAGKTAEKIVIKGLKKQYTIITHLLVLHSSIFHHSVHRYIWYYVVIFIGKQFW